MPHIQIPRTCQYRGQLTYAKLLLRICPRRPMATAFEGKLLKPGARIDEAELWPTPDYPEIPILLEYAGNDRSGWGHRRSNDIYLLWRYDRAASCWEELIRSTSQGAEWIEHLKPVALQELRRRAPPADAEQAAEISGRVLGMLDDELEMLCPVDRHLVMSFVYQEFSARAVAFTV